MRSDPTRLLGIALVLIAVATEAASGQPAVSGSVRNGGTPVGNAAIYLIPLDDDEPSPEGPTATIDQVHLTFQPNVVVVTPGTEVSFLNSDGVLHNVFGPGLDGRDEFDLGTYDIDERRSRVFRQGGLHIVLCHIHPEMAAYVIVAPTRFKGLSDAAGEFAIEGVPPGRYRLHAWHARHWRDEVTRDVSVSEEGVRDLVITLGRQGPPRGRSR